MASHQADERRVPNVSERAGFLASSGLIKADLWSFRSHNPTLIIGGPHDAESAGCLCAPGRTRTCNLLIRSQVLYPLSYGRWWSPTIGTDGTVYRVRATARTTGRSPRRLRDSNPGWAVNPNRISSAAP